jgi:hypothetical protein
MAPMVEADRDGRLDRRDKGSLERHVALCVECRRLRADLDRLATLAARRVLPEASALEQKRARAALLQRAAFSAAPRRSLRPSSRLGLGLAAAVALVVGAGFAVPRARDAGPTAMLARKLPPRPQLLESLFETTIRPDPGARYTRSRTDLLEQIDLEEGAVELQVRHLGPGERFVVATADAEVEVRGTSFRVEAHGRRIAAVSVHEGRVEVRYAGFVVRHDEGDPVGHEGTASGSTPRAPGEREARAGGSGDIVLEKGEAWSPSRGRAELAPAVTEPSTIIVPAGSVKTGAPPTPIAPATARPVTMGETHDRPAQPAASASHDGRGSEGAAAQPQPGGAFAEGMRLIERGDYAAGADKLDTYRRTNRADPRAEDAAYLTILALQRAGRRDEARAAARRYLADYPKGYRRAEAERIAR